MADLNNEKPIKNIKYKERMVALEKLILVRWTKDRVIFPTISEQFGYIDKENGTILNMTDTDLYK